VEKQGRKSILYGSHNQHSVSTRDTPIFCRVRAGMGDVAKDDEPVRIPSLRCKIMSLGAALAVVLLATGCDDEVGVSHTPPTGQGALIIDNETPTQVDVYLGGVFEGAVDNYKDQVWDLEPGVYRVVLNEQDGNRNYAADVDILEGRNTVLNVRISSSGLNQYDVLLERD
jgi:hypothetical protein